MVLLRLALALTLFASGWSCANTATPVAPTAPTAAAPSLPVGAAQAFVEEVLVLLERNAVYRHRINWPDVRSRTIAAAAGALSYDDTRPALAIAMGALGEIHSSIRNAGGLGTFLRAGYPSCTAPDVSGPAVSADIGYVRLRGFGELTDSPAAAVYVAALHAEIARQDRPDLTGWVVDLRGNGGGNMWPMLAGVGPLLGDGVAGHFVFPDARPSPWGYRAGQAFQNTSIAMTVSMPHVRQSRSTRVAVLTDRATGSAAEAIVIAFIGRADTRRFGEASCGLTTSVGQIPVSTGHTLLLATGLMADRDARAYEDQLVPDEVTDQAGTLTRAVDWLRGFGASQ